VAPINAVQSSWAWGVLLLYVMSFLSAGPVQHENQETMGIGLPLGNYTAEVMAIVLMYLVIIALYPLLCRLAHVRPLRWFLPVVNSTRHYRVYQEPDTTRRNLICKG
jgi:hypothetical protein